MNQTKIQIAQLLLDRMSLESDIAILCYLLLWAKYPSSFSICSCPLGIVNRSIPFVCILQGLHFILWI